MQQHFESILYDNLHVFVLNIVSQQIILNNHKYTYLGIVMDSSSYLPSCIALVLADIFNIVDIKFLIRQIQSVFYVTCFNNKNLNSTYSIFLKPN